MVAGYATNCFCKRQRPLHRQAGWLRRKAACEPVGRWLFYSLVTGWLANRDYGSEHKDWRPIPVGAEGGRYKPARAVTRLEQSPGGVLRRVDTRREIPGLSGDAPGPDDALGTAAERRPIQPCST